MKRFAIILMGLLVLAFIGSPLVMAKAETLKIGVIAPLSGPGAPWGIAIQRGVEIAAQEINAAGGIKAGGKTYEVKVIAVDDMYSGKGGVDGATKLIYQDQVKFIIGSISSASILAFQPITEPQKVLAFVNSYSNEVLRKEKPYTFRIIMTSYEIGKVEYKWLKDNKPQVKKLAIISPNDASGWAVSEHVRMAAKPYGYEVVFDQYYERGTVDFYPILTKMTAKKPDWLDLGASPTGDQALLMKQVREMGYKGGMSATTQMTPETLVKVAGKSAEGFISAGLDATGPLATKQEKEFEKTYMAKYGPPFNPTSLIFYPPLYIIKQGIEAANSIDSTAVMKKIAEPGWIFDVMGLPTRWGGQDYYGIDRQIFDTVSICELRDGKLRTIKRFSSEEVEKLVKVGK